MCLNEVRFVFYLILQIRFEVGPKFRFQLHLLSRLILGLHELFHRGHLLNCNFFVEGAEVPDTSFEGVLQSEHNY
jgi:hypothetical protein